MEDASSNGETIDNFVPGYVNTTMNLNLGQIDNTTGGLSIYIDIINTTDTTYVASTTSSISGAEITVGGTIDGDGIPQSDILTTDMPSGTIEIVISAPDIAILDLNQFSITLDEVTGYDVTVEVVTPHYNLGVSEPYFIINGQQTYYMTQVETFNLHNVTSIQFAINGVVSEGHNYMLSATINYMLSATSRYIHIGANTDGSYNFSDIIPITENITIQTYNNYGGGSN